MIYHIYFSQLSFNVERVNAWNKARYPNAKVGDPVPGQTPTAEQLADFIKSSKDDSFMFVLVDRGYDHYNIFAKWVKDYGLEGYEVLRTDSICNPVHKANGYNLQLVVMQSLDHFQRKEYKNDEVVQAGC